MSKPNRKVGSITKNRKPRVLILGAGASASCGIAVARDILREALQLLLKRNAEQAEKVLDLVRYLYPGFREDLSNYPNVEDFLNLVEIAKEFHTEAYIESRKWSQERLQERIDITLRAITEYIWEFMANEEKRKELSTLVRELVRSGDVVISFNWDFMIDLCLEDIGTISLAYTYQPSKKSVTLLKPHGSIDWFEKNKLPSDDKKLMKLMRYRANGLFFYPYFEISEKPDLLKHLPFIIPPLSTKKFDGFLQHVWKDVYKAIGRAKELYIIGYSLPREDQFARLVIGRAIQCNNLGRRGALPVVIVNPDEGVLATFVRLVNTGVRFFPVSLKNYVTSLKQQHEE